jgi:hypothetical protein
MNKNDFIKLVNILVEKKIKELLPKMIEDEIKKHTESGIQPDAQDFENDDDLKNLIPNTNYRDSILRDGSTKKGAQTEGKKWSKNSAINKILNETAQSFKPLPKDPTDTLSGGNYQQMLSEEYENVGDEFTFNTKNMTDVVNRTPVTPGKPAVNNLKNELLQEPGAAPEIVNAMVKDYSKMLKKIDKSAKAKRGGGMPLKSGVGESW